MHKHIFNHKQPTLRRDSRDCIFMRWLQLFLLLLLVPLGACSLNHVTTYPAESRGPYELDAGDVIAVSVYGDETISKSYKVDEAGMISMRSSGRSRSGA